MGNSCTSPKTEESIFRFAFNNPEFSDRILRLEILPPGQDDHDSESISNVKFQFFFTHSLLLAARSPFFHKLLNNGMKESQDNNATFTLRIKASEEAAVMDLLRFIYDKPLKANSETEWLEVLIVADKYEVSSCIRHCIEMLDKFPMTVESALFYLELPSIVFVSEKAKPLLDQVTKYLVSHFKGFTEAQQEAAMELPLSAVEALLGGNGLRVNSEDVVFDFVIKWARLHYPELEERREILTNRLARFICFENLSCSKLKSNLGCPDFEHERLTELIFDALSSKVEAPYGQYENTSPRRKYNNPLVKVVHLKLAQPRCVVFFDLTKEDCADLVPLQKLCSQTFCVGGQTFNLLAERVREKDTLGIYVHKEKEGGSETCTLDVHFLVMDKLSKQFTALGNFVNVFKSGMGWGYHDPFKTPWKKLTSSNYFIDGTLHLRADITLIN